MPPNHQTGPHYFDRQEAWAVCTGKGICLYTISPSERLAKIKWLERNGGYVHSTTKTGAEVEKAWEQEKDRDHIHAEAQRVVVHTKE